ncbi:MAG: type II RES/Xre toxin-antitoxin system antitoxin, partial [Vulcanimicrobiaceae bacterium]
QVREGFPPSALGEIEATLGLTHAALGKLLAIPARSFARRVKTRRLSHAESDVLYRIARIYALAVDTLGNAGRATRWLKTENQALGGDKPIWSLDTEVGARLVEDVLGRIRYGVYS